MNFGFSGEMIFLFFLALILFGPKKLPEIGRTIGRFMNEFRRASNEFRSQIETEINALDTQSKPQQILPPNRKPLGSLANRILNPASAERAQVAEARTVETPSSESAASYAENSAANDDPAIETQLSAPPAPPTHSKVAPDA